MVMLVKPEQYLKHSEPKEVTEEGIVMLVKPEHDEKLQIIVTNWLGGKCYS